MNVTSSSTTTAALETAFPVAEIYPTHFDPRGEDFDRIYRELDAAREQASRLGTTDGLEWVVGPGSGVIDRVLDRVWRGQHVDVSARNYRIDDVAVFHRVNDDRVVLIVTDTVEGEGRVVDDATGEVVSTWSRSDASTRDYLVTLERGERDGWRILDDASLGPAGVHPKAFPDVDGEGVTRVDAGTADGHVWRAYSWETATDTCVAVLIDELDAAGWCGDVGSMNVEAGRFVTRNFHRSVPGSDLAMRIVFGTSDPAVVRVVGPLDEGRIELFLLDSGFQVGVDVGRYDEALTVVSYRGTTATWGPAGRIEAVCGEWTSRAVHPLSGVADSSAFSGDLEETRQSIAARFDDAIEGDPVTATVIERDDAPAGIGWLDSRVTDLVLVEATNVGRDGRRERWLVGLAVQIVRNADGTPYTGPDAPGAVTGVVGLSQNPDC